ncbi:MAG: phosphatidylserine decarboxylase [Alphaproteobacteria bacterium]|nr:phosphatidylserine decarboxylase [Alphaproteobacteria bacterium]
MRQSETNSPWLAPIHPQGRIFVAIAAVATLVLYWFSPVLGTIGVFATLGVGAFFRDPERVPPQDKGAVLAGGDGRIEAVVHVPPPAELGLGDGARLRISTFLSLFNVHVNRVPVSGTVKSVRYVPGKFVNASLDKASTDNERNSVHIVTPEGVDVVVVQIAGLVARRIVCDLKEGQVVRAGDRLGLIRFGSRVDVFLPAGTPTPVRVGQTAVGGETVLARLGEQE